MFPFISVIIPAYNTAQYLPTAIQSALNQKGVRLARGGSTKQLTPGELTELRTPDEGAQTKDEFEIIVVDDGSTDDTPTVTRRYGDAVRYVHQENQGLAAARNTGIRLALGEYVALLDADDEWLDGYLANMVEAAQRSPNASVLYSGIRCMDANGKELPQQSQVRVVAPAAMYDTLLRANFLIPSAAVIRRSDVLAADLFDPALRRLEDWDLWLRLLRQGAMFVGVHGWLVRYRLHSSSLSGNTLGMQRAKLAVVEKLFGPDDGRQEAWPWDKRRAYGGYFRYCALTSVLDLHDWRSCAQHLGNGLKVDPSLASDLDLMYELALGAQPVGYRNSGVALDLTANLASLETTLAETFAHPWWDQDNPSQTSAAASLQRTIKGTAYYALGLVAYNTGQTSMARRLLLKSLRLRRDLWGDHRITVTLLKSVLGPRAIQQLRRLRHSPNELS